MRNIHIFKNNITCVCPNKDCGKDFTKTITVEYETNQKGDVIGHRIF